MALLRNEEKDAIKSGTLRVTLGTQAVAILGAIVTGLNPLLGEEFSDGQKTAIIIAAVALVAVVTAADVLARAWVTSASSVRATPLPKPMAVRVITTGEDFDGLAVEFKLEGEDPSYLVVPSNGTTQAASWHAREQLRFLPQS